jgi:hypothetical protein
MSESVVLPAPLPEVTSALEKALERSGADRMTALGDIVRMDPLCLEAWARLGEGAYEAGDDIASYAYTRVGYHRGLDLLRSSGWRPDREVHWTYESNRGFLLALYGLMRAAASISEGVEARRCREFLLQLDPSDPLSVGEIQPKDLSRRLPE